ncbi:MAG: hypothetical protein MUP86_02900 [Dehalococcoidia bacterium]|nr:hypothetical protein [Dehalococcoidia bacterium]
MADMVKFGHPVKIGPCGPLSDSDRIVFCEDTYVYQGEADDASRFYWTCCQDDGCVILHDRAKMAGDILDLSDCEIIRTIRQIEAKDGV